MRLVIGPRMPEPICTRSTERMGDFDGLSRVLDFGQDPVGK